MQQLHAPDTPLPVSLVMRTLGDPTRRGLYEEIVRRGETTVVALTRDAGISQPAVSQHLKSLREAGLVVERRAGRNAFYRPEPAGLAPLVDWLDHYSAFWRDRMTALRGLLQEIDPK
jgi:DNA-binding transcriptional ArsR family regulator